MAWLERVYHSGVNFDRINIPEGMEVVTLESTKFTPSHVCVRKDTVYGDYDGNSGGYLQLKNCVRLPFPVDLREVTLGNKSWGVGDCVDKLAEFFRGLRESGEYSTDNEFLPTTMIGDVYFIRGGEFGEDCFNDRIEACKAADEEKRRDRILS